jgi:hypothetical protein
MPDLAQLQYDFHGLMRPLWKFVDDDAIVAIER